MAHDHAHSHDHSHGHSHAPAVDTADARKRVALAAFLTFAFMIAEVVGGVISGSLALLADAAHMLTDAGSLALAWLGFKLAERPVYDRRSFGWARFKILAAFVNGMALLLLAAWIIFEAVQRLITPEPVMGNVLMGVAIAGLLVNILAFVLLHGGDQEDLNLQGALWHVAGDLLGSVAAIAAALVIIFTGWMPIDPLLSMLVAGLIIIGGVRVTLQSAHILIEGVPSGLEPADIKADLEAHLTDAAKIGHIHAWALTEQKPLVTLEVTAKDGVCLDTLRKAVKDRLEEKFGVSHATVEVRKPVQ
ncbi:cation diffusion facilitator family transporter [Henriciella aquimarina]|uniref:cation diffusion facilitator family transporter n=1 Tax=Henriciella aquimarina TaxID=545261 RepID=UPI000A0518E7|nr:cation diffusion facilitator family transporter [Henriciella aquimarina]